MSVLLLLLHYRPAFIGDHPSTATAIAKEIGLVGEKEKVSHYFNM